MRVDDDLWNRAAEIARDSGESVSDLIRDSLAEYVELHDDPAWTRAQSIARERGDDLSAIVRAALIAYVG